MKRKDYIDLKGKTVADLTKMVSVKRTDAIKKKMQILAGKEKNLKVYRNLRADIAKILTLVKEKEILEKVQTEESPSEIASKASHGIPLDAPKEPSNRERKKSK